MTDVVIYYHGTLRQNERSIKKRGVCSPAHLGISARDYPAYMRIDPHAIYVSEDFADAAHFGEGEGNDRKPNPTIYRITHLPKKCKVNFDAAISGALKITECPCIKPESKCRVSSKQLEHVAQEEGVIPPGWEDEHCNWVKV